MNHTTYWSKWTWNWYSIKTQNFIRLDTILNMFLDQYIKQYSRPNWKQNLPKLKQLKWYKMLSVRGVILITATFFSTLSHQQCSTWSPERTYYTKKKNLKKDPGLHRKLISKYTIVIIQKYFSHVIMLECFVCMHSRSDSLYQNYTRTQQSENISHIGSNFKRL